MKNSSCFEKSKPHYKLQARKCFTLKVKVGLFNTKKKKPHVFVLPAQACFCNRAAWCNDISYFNCPFVTVGFLPGIIAQKKTRTGNLMSLFFVPVCNSQILVFLDTT